MELLDTARLYEIRLKKYKSKDKKNRTLIYFFTFLDFFAGNFIHIRELRKVAPLYTIWVI